MVNQNGIHVDPSKIEAIKNWKAPTTPSEIRSFLGLAGSPGVVPSPDYIPGLEEPQSPPPLDYVPEPIYPEYMPQEDEVFPAEEQPLHAVASPTAQSPDYVPESDPEVDPEEDDDEDPEEDPDDEADDIDIEADDDEEEEEHPAPIDSVVVALLAADQAPSAEETEPFETDESAATPPPHPAYRVTARISIPALVPTPVWSYAEVARLLAISTSSSSPLSSWSSPLPQIPSPPLPVSPQLPVSSLVPVLSLSPPASPIRSLGYRTAMFRLRAEAASTSYLLPLLPPIILSHTRPAAPSLGTPPLHLLSTDHKEDRPESSSAAAARPAGGLRADYGFVATMDREIRRDPERDVGYGITDSWDEIVETLQGAPVSTDTELGRHMTAFETRVRQDTDEIYTRLDDEQSQRQLLAGRLNMLFRDRRAHAHTCFLMETEAKMSREAWVGSMGASDLAHNEVMSLYITVLAQQSQIRELQFADRRRQTVISELLAADYRRQRQLTENQAFTTSLAARNANTMASTAINSGSSAGRNERAHSWYTYRLHEVSTINFKHRRRFFRIDSIDEKMETVTVGNDIAYAMTWTELKKKIMNKVLLRTEIKKLEVELWELKVKGTDVIGYNQRFQELALLCGRMFPEESDKIEKYVGGLPDMIHGSVVASKPKTMQEATEMAIEVMDKRIRTFADRQTEKL
ncbi:reverse transcriptase domain-containing protein [Tanacetum coccineum]